MFTTFFSFVISGILFLIASLIIGRNVWTYYVPFSLVFLTIWLKVIQSAWKQEKEKMITDLARHDPSAAAGWVSILSVIYGIFSLIIGNWISLVVCGIVFIVSLTLKFFN